jgi:hypothetical protein
MTILFKACQHQARKCLETLLLSGSDVGGSDDVDERSLVHRLVIAGGSFDASATSSTHSTFKTNKPQSLNVTVPSHLADAKQYTVVNSSHEPTSTDDPTLIEFILQHSTAAVATLNTPDIYGRIPLHYAGALSVVGQYDIHSRSVEWKSKYCTRADSSPQACLGRRLR